MAVPKRAPHGSFLLVQSVEWAEQQDWLTGFKVNSYSNWWSWEKKKVDATWESSQRKVWIFHGKTHSHLFSIPYLVEFVNIDLSLLISLRAHVHRSADQEEVGVRIPVHIDGLQDAAEVRTDLQRGVMCQR